MLDPEVLDIIRQNHQAAYEPEVLNHLCGEVGEGNPWPLIDEVCRASGKPVPVIEAQRRPGDPAKLVGSSERIRSELGWTPGYSDISSIVETAWRWHTRER